MSEQLNLDGKIVPKTEHIIYMKEECKADILTNDIWKGIEKCFKVDDTVWYGLGCTLWDYINGLVKEITKKKINHISGDFMWEEEVRADE